MPTPYEYAILSSVAYKRTGSTSIVTKTGDWQWVMSSKTNDFGYYGVVYKNLNTSEMIIVHCGTDPSVFQNLRDDLKLARGKTPVAYNEVVKPFSKFVHENFEAKYSISETGHSLGAVYAELNAVEFDCKAVTFESPGIKDLTNNNEIEDTYENITSYLAAPNFINTGRHVGRIIRVYPLHVETNGFQVNDVKGYLNYLSIFAGNYYKVISSLGMDFFNYTERLHSIEHILKVFDPDIGAPYLQSTPIAWPSRQDYLKSKIWANLHPIGKTDTWLNKIIPWTKEAGSTLLNEGRGRVVERNIRLERNLAGGSMGGINNYSHPLEFRMPDLSMYTDLSIEYVKKYIQRAYEEYDTFYKYPVLRDRLNQQLDKLLTDYNADLLTVEEPEPIAIKSPKIQKNSQVELLMKQTVLFEELQSAPAQDVFDKKEPMVVSSLTI